MRVYFAEGPLLSGDNPGYVVQPIAADQPSSDVESSEVVVPLNTGPEAIWTNDEAAG
jgi:hypothetical protein